MVRGRSQPCSTSFLIDFSKAASFRFVFDDFLFPHKIITAR